MSMHHFINLGVFLCFLLFVSACSHTEKKAVPLTSELSANNKFSSVVLEEQEPFKFAIASILSIRETHRIYHKFINYLEEELDRPVEIIQKQTYAEIKELFEQGEIDAGIVCSYLAVIGNQSGIFESIAMPVKNQEKVFTSYIIVRKDSEFETFVDLKSHSFAFSDPLSYSGFIVPNYELKKAGYELNGYFSNSYYTYSHDNTIIAVANGLVDGGATHSDIYQQLEAENNPLIQQIKIIGEGPYVGNSPIVVSSNIDKSVKGKLTNVVLAMHLNNKGQKALEKLNINYFIKPENKLYEPINQMLAELGDSK